MDQQKLRSLVFEKTGVKVDTDDPIFALVALNEAVLAETVERHVALLNEAAQELALQARAFAGGERPPAAVPASAAQAPGTPAPRELRLLGAAAAIALLSALLVLGGQALLFKPQAARAPLLQALALTPAQAAAIRHGEKLEKAVQRLDQASRRLIQAEMQKP